jgi:hypothetical protein
MRSGEREFWRVVNASADSLLDLQVLYDGNPQSLQIVGLDGVPVDSQDGNGRGKIIEATHVLIPTAGRAQFIVSNKNGRLGDPALPSLTLFTLSTSTPSSWSPCGGCRLASPSG